MACPFSCQLKQKKKNQHCSGSLHAKSNEPIWTHEYKSSSCVTVKLWLSKATA